MQGNVLKSRFELFKTRKDDSLEQDLKSHLTISNEFIKNSVLNDESVLVHCYSGISRSASIIIGYLIIVKNISYEEAYLLLKSKSIKICPNSNFMFQLSSLKFAKDIMLI